MIIHISIVVYIHKNLKIRMSNNPKDYMKSYIRLSLVMQFNHITLSNISNARTRCIESIDRKKSCVTVDQLKTLHKLSIDLYNSSNLGYIPRFRYKWVKEFGWCVPTLKFIDHLQRFAGNRGSVVFPAAGLAWLPMLVSLMPCCDGSYFDHQRIIVSDIHTDDNIWYPHKVEDGVKTASNTTVDDTMIISWAPDATELGTNMLRAFNGCRLIVIGEGRGGYTASESFFTELTENWTVDISENEAHILQWNDARDNATFYHRKCKKSNHNHTLNKILHRIDMLDIIPASFLLNLIYRLLIDHPVVLKN